MPRFWPILPLQQYAMWPHFPVSTLMRVLESPSPSNLTMTNFKLTFIFMDDGWWWCLNKGDQKSIWSSIVGHCAGVNYLPSQWISPVVRLDIVRWRGGAQLSATQSQGQCLKDRFLLTFKKKFVQPKGNVNVLKRTPWELKWVDVDKINISNSFWELNQARLGRVLWQRLSDAGYVCGI